MSEPHSFLLSVEEGENNLIFPVATHMLAQRLAALIAQNPRVQSVITHRVISSTRTTRTPQAAPVNAQPVEEQAG